ncbi:hypothetical protein AHAS_Ahas05G0047700 [Arachis hypogaea]|nr:uncharacterized protein LOC112800899 isoform X1 [Arachis hypogaea]
MSAYRDEDPRLHGIKTKIRVVPHFPKSGIMFQDITTLLLDPKAFKDTIDLFVERYKGKNISVVAGKYLLYYHQQHDFGVPFFFISGVYLFWRVVVVSLTSVDRSKVGGVHVCEKVGRNMHWTVLYIIFGGCLYGMEATVCFVLGCEL